MLVTLADPHQPLEAGQEVELQLVDPLYFDAAGRRIAATSHRGNDPMTIEPEMLKSLVKAAAEQVIASAPELTALDQAIGDGDHGVNMKRGFEAVLGKLDVIGEQPLDEAFKTIGKTLVMTIGALPGRSTEVSSWWRVTRCRTAGNCPRTSRKCSAARGCGERAGPFPSG